MENSKFNPEESLFITYAKAFGIIIVVIGHIRTHILPHDPYIYQMALFFIIGGILAGPIIDAREYFVEKFFRKHIYYIVVWYCVLGIATLLCNRLFGTRIAIKLADDGLLSFVLLPLRSNMHNNSLFIAAWFLVAYLFATALFRLSINVIAYFNIPKQLLLILGLSIGFFSIGFISPLYKHSGHWAANLICQILVGYMYMSIGYFIRNHLYIFKNIPMLFLGIIMMTTFAVNGFFSIMEMAWSNYPDGFFVHLGSSIIGCYVVLSLASIFSTGLRSQTLSIIGEHSKDIMTLHLLAFVIMDFIVIYVRNLPSETTTQIDSQGHFISSAFWEGYYVAGGVIIPLFISYFVMKLRGMVVYHRGKRDCEGY